MLRAGCWPSCSGHKQMGLRVPCFRAQLQGLPWKSKLAHHLQGGWHRLFWERNAVSFRMTPKGSSFLALSKPQKKCYWLEMCKKCIWWCSLFEASFLSDTFWLLSFHCSDIAGLQTSLSLGSGDGVCLIFQKSWQQVWVLASRKSETQVMWDWGAALLFQHWFALAKFSFVF